MTFVIPQKDKKFVVDNASMSRGNIYSTFNVMFDADKGRIKLNPPISKVYDSDVSNEYLKYITAQLVADKNGGGGADIYILSTYGGGYSAVYSTVTGSLVGLVGASAPNNSTDATSDMCLFNSLMMVDDQDGLHYVAPSASAGAWTLIATNANWKNWSIMKPFNYTNRLYVYNGGNAIFSMDTSYSLSTSGAYTQTNIPETVRCMAISSQRVWYATSPSNNISVSHIYEWDGVSPNPIAIHTVDTAGIQSMTILNDSPVAIDLKGRLWFWDGYTFKQRDGANIPFKEDETGIQSCFVHRNGMIVSKDKIYVLVGTYNLGTRNSTERMIGGIWCYDPNIGFYHFSSPDNYGLITSPYSLIAGTTDNTLCLGYYQAINTDYVWAKTDLTSTDTRIGWITTQFLESNSLADMFQAIAVKYRKMIDTGATIEVKYRTWKNIECMTAITWTAATQFTVTTDHIDGTGTYYCTPVAVGDEIVIQNGVNAGRIAHITVIGADVAGITTITIDRAMTTTTGNAYALISNYKLMDTITNDTLTYKNIRIGEPATMIQVKLVMSWAGYWDEVQEILVLNKTQEYPV